MKLTPTPITSELFAPFGEVIDPEARAEQDINDGNARRLDDLCHIEVVDKEGRAGFSLFRADPRPLPFSISMLERHPLGSQAFFPLSGEPFVVVVAPPGKAPSHSQIQVFSVTEGKGVNFFAGTWHHPLIAPAGGNFAVMDRIGPGDNCDIHPLTDQIEIGKADDS